MFVHLIFASFIICENGLHNTGNIRIDPYKTYGSALNTVKVTEVLSLNSKRGTKTKKFMKLLIHKLTKCCITKIFVVSEGWETSIFCYDYICLVRQPIIRGNDWLTKRSIMAL